jgi:hypothetical protein
MEEDKEEAMGENKNRGKHILMRKKRDPFEMNSEIL